MSLVTEQPRKVFLLAYLGKTLAFCALACAAAYLKGASRPEKPDPMPTLGCMYCYSDLMTDLILT